MTGASQKRQGLVDELLADAMELQPVQRREFLARNAPDPEILAETLDLIEHAARLDEEDAARGNCGRATGDRIGPYSVRWLLGHGTFGEVYLAIREDIGQRLALKLLKSSADPGVQARFEHEARILASLDHPNITRLVDYGRTPDGHLYLVMDLADGGNLSDWVKLNKPGGNELLRLFVKVCDAVQHAHSNLIIHRDIKPSNILMDARGEPKLADFGLVQMLGPLASVVAGTPALEAPGGTPVYASPEQFSGAPLSTASDVFSLGVVLKEVLGDLSNGNARDDDAGPIVRRCLQESPKARYANAGELRDDIEAYLAHRPLKAGPNNRIHLAKLFVLRHRSAVAVSAVGLMLLLAALAWIWRQNLELERAAITLRAVAKEKTDRLDRVMEAAEHFDEVQRVEYKENWHSNPDARVALIEAKRTMQGAPTLASRFNTAVCERALAEVLLRADNESERREGWSELRRAREILETIRATNPDYLDAQRELETIDGIQKELEAGRWTGGLGVASARTPPKLRPGAQSLQAIEDGHSARALGDVWRSLGQPEKASAAYERAVQLFSRAASDGVGEAVKERDEAIRLTGNPPGKRQGLPQ